MVKQNKKMNYVICRFCKWVHFQVSREHAKNEVKTFNEYYDSLSKEQQEQCYGSTKSSIRNYERCMLCGTCYHNFRRAKASEVPFGSTVSPIINKKD